MSFESSTIVNGLVPSSDFVTSYFSGGGATVPINDVIISALAAPPNIPSMLTFDANFPYHYTLYFAQSLLGPGTYVDEYGDGSLTINDLSIAPTPEPSTLALLGTGALGTFGVIRKRSRSAPLQS